MLRSKKGLSTVVASLLIILLVIVAVGVIWTVFNSTVESGTGQLDLGSKCLAVSVKATAVSCDSGNCSVTLKRDAGGEDIGGVKMIFYNINETESSSVDRSGNIAELATVTNTGVDSTLNASISKVDIIPYFLDESGNEQLCSTGTTFDNVNNA